MKNRKDFTSDAEYIAYLEMHITFQDKQLTKLEAANIEASWRDNPDRMGGQFTDAELLEVHNNRW